MPTEDRDPFEILRQNNPVDPASLPDSTTKRARQLLRGIKADRMPNRRRLVVRTAIAVGTALLLIAAAWLWYQEATEVQGVTCYSATDLNADRAGVRPTDQPSVEVCGEAWATGVLENPEIEPGTVPPLTGCVNRDGALLVFPTSDISSCSDLGLANHESPPDTTNTRPSTTELQSALVDYFSSQGCAPYEEAVTDVQEIMNTHGLDEWQLITQNEQASRPCASFSLDTNSETVHLIRIPHP